MEKEKTITANFKGIDFQMPVSTARKVLNLQKIIRQQQNSVTNKSTHMDPKDQTGKEPETKEEETVTHDETVTTKSTSKDDEVIDDEEGEAADADDDAD